jgi:hypothetical protein
MSVITALSFAISAAHFRHRRLSAVVGGTDTQRIGFSGAYHDSTNKQW